MDTFIQFIGQMFRGDGTISAPQVVGTFIAVFSCVLAACHYSNGVLIPLFSTAGSLLIGGSFEVYTAKKWAK
jgi:hypothetical protein